MVLLINAFLSSRGELVSWSFQTNALLGSYHSFEVAWWFCGIIHIYLLCLRIYFLLQTVNAQIFISPISVKQALSKGQRVMNLRPSQTSFLDPHVPLEEFHMFQLLTATPSWMLSLTVMPEKLFLLKLLTYI